jgi:hypothetical protein
MSERIGEIIETTSTGLVAECETLNKPPALGSLARVAVGDGRDVYAVVAFGRTGGLDPSRRAVKRGSAEFSDATIYERHPELSRILRTEFGVVIVGWSEGGRIWQRLPSQPPPLHFSLYACDQATAVQFSDQLGYLRLLLAYGGEMPADQLLAANIRELYRARGNDLPWLERAGKEAASLLKNDYERLMNVLLAIEP